MLFIDFEKAFDIINRQCVRNALRRHKIGYMCCIEEVEVDNRLRQGCILSPKLFLLVIGDVLDVLSEIREGVQWTKSSFFRRLDYADIIYLLSHRVMGFDRIA